MHTPAMMDATKVCISTPGEVDGTTMGACVGTFTDGETAADGVADASVTAGIENWISARPGSMKSCATERTLAIAAVM